MRLFNTAQKTYRDFVPGHVASVYVCGITPYDSAHLGHIFTFMTYDLLQRRLEDLGHEVRLVRNVTDVDEPIYQKARELDVPYTDLAESETRSFQDILNQLHFRPTFAEPRASEYIDEMATAVQELLDKGLAYRLDNDIYYTISQYPDFGHFSGFSDRLQTAFMAMRGGDPKRAGKRHPHDFLLWKGVSDEQDPAKWDTVVGTGRPGWHIECTVMSRALLGDHFDLHGGGTDLIFPHHECEVAQSVGLTGRGPADVWMHVSPLLYDGEKMSKSLGNLVFARDLLKQHDAATIRLALMHYHHRMGGEWQPEMLDEAKRLFHNVEIAAAKSSRLQAEQLLTDVRNALDDDLNTLEVVDALHHFIAAVEDAPSTDRADGAQTVAQVLLLLGLSAE